MSHSPNFGNIRLFQQSFGNPSSGYQVSAFESKLHLKDAIDETICLLKFRPASAQEVLRLSKPASERK